jgi:hypothetical protein
MRSRFLAGMLGAILAMGLAACSKKEQPAQTPPATTDQTAQQAPATAPSTQAAPAQQAAAPAEQPAAPAAAPVAEQAPPPPPPPQPIVIPAGRNVVVTMGSSVSSKDTSAGQTFPGSLTNAITSNGNVVIPAGTAVTVAVSEAKSAGRFKGEGIIAIRLVSIDIHGVSRNISTDEYVVTSKGKGKRSAVAIGGGAAGGALIGGLAGGGKGAGIGALVGAGAGTVGAAFTGNKELTIPAESAVSFKTTAPITIQP